MKNNTIIRKQLNIEVKEFDTEEGILKAVISSGLPDRGGDIVEQSSWLLDNYMLNPVVLWGHDHSIPAIGQALSIGLNENGMLEAVIKFAVNESAFAREVFNLYAGKFIRAFSVGFISGEEEMVNGNRILRNNELIEFSAVNVPMDALALAKSKGNSIAMIEKMMEVEEKEGRVLSTKNREVLEKARDALNKVLSVDNAPKAKKAKPNYNRVLNKAIRDLISARNAKN